MARSGGPKPNPAGLRIAAGTNKANPGRENPDTPRPTGELGKPLNGMSKRAKEIWREYAPYWLRDTDRLQWREYCQAVADAEALRKALGDDPSTWIYESDKGNQLRHPNAIQYKERLEFANRLAQQFGMDATSINRVKAPPRTNVPDPGSRHFPS